MIRPCWRVCRSFRTSIVLIIPSYVQRDSLNKAEVENAVLYNKKLSYFEEYKYQIIGVVSAFLVLLFGFFLALYFYFRTKRFKDALWHCARKIIS